MDQSDSKEVASNATLAYLAGFFDGEGYIGISKRAGPNALWRSSVFTLTVAVTQLNPEPLKLFYGLFGGHLKQYSNKQKNARNYYLWTVSSRKAVIFIEIIRPFLIVKKEEADTALEFAATITDISKRSAGGVFPRLSESTITLRESLYGKMRDLKKRKF